MVTVQYMWIDDTSADVIKVDFEALYHGDVLVEGIPRSSSRTSTSSCRRMTELSAPRGAIPRVSVCLTPEHSPVVRPRRTSVVIPRSAHRLLRLRATMLFRGRHAHRGAMRIAPSRRITSPLSIGFSMMCTASAPYSSGSPSRAGCGTCLPSDSCASSGSEPSSGVLNRPGAMVHDADQLAREVAGDRQGHADHAALGRRVGGLADLAVERRDRRGVDDDAALLADRFGLGDPLGAPAAAR